MKIESTDFSWADLDNFINDLVDYDRRLLADRLDRISERLGELGSRVEDGAVEGTARWSAKEVLAHITVLSKFYGTLTYLIGSGRLPEFDLLANVSQRDVIGATMAHLPASQLVQMAQADHSRTAEYLRSADPAAMRRRTSLGDGNTFSAREMAALPLCAHLELHLQQLERALERGH
jgi:hypothetical protein